MDLYIRSIRSDFVMNKNGIRILGNIVVVSIALIVCISFMSKIVKSKETEKKYGEFYNAGLEYDVLFCGSSHMMHSVYPMELYRDYGISSYNIANSAEALPTTYWVLKTALENSNPKVVVLEVFFNTDRKVTKDQESLLHTWFDGVRLSKMKYQAIDDLLPEKKMEYLLPFSLYHNRWNAIQKSDFGEDYAPLRGAKVINGLYQMEEPVSETDKVSELPKESIEYVSRIKELCDEKGIELLLVLNPYGAKDIELERLNLYEQVSEELGVEYIDLIHSDVVNYSTDLADRAHLNPSGARKVTRWYGEYLLENYDLPTYAGKEKWDEDYKRYLNYKDETIVDCADLEEYLLYIKDSDYSCRIVLAKDGKIANAEKIQNLLSNMENIELIYAKEAESDIRIEVQRAFSEKSVDVKQFVCKDDLSFEVVK